MSVPKAWKTKKKKVSDEFEKIKEEKSEIKKIIGELNTSYSKLKRDKFVNRAYQKVIQKMKMRISNNLDRINKRKKVLNTNYDCVNKENFEYSILGLSEYVMPLDNCDSPVPDVNLLEIV